MAIQDQITALLNGELTDEIRVSELLHVLAVSPEKRDVLLEQIKLSRAFSALGAGITPSHEADNRIWQGIAEIDGEFLPARVPAMAPVATLAAPAAAGLFRTSLIALALVGLGLGLGYLFWYGDTGTSTVHYRTVTTRDTVTTTLLESARDTLSMLRSQLTSLTAERDRALASRVRVVQSAVSAPRVERGVVEAISSEATQTPTLTLGPDVTAVPLVSTRPTAARSSAAHDVASISDAGRSTPLPLIADVDAEPILDTSPDAWQLGVRDHFRLSLPRVYGLAGQRSILFDRELLVGYRLGGTEYSPTTLRISAAAGETQFAQVYHTNLGGSPKDTIIEQSPTLLYGRVMVTPELLRVGNITGSLEVGGGGTMIGPFATLGLDLELTPVSSFSVHAGASSWILWTEFREQLYMSTNLNVHLGLTFGF